MDAGSTLGAIPRRHCTSGTWDFLIHEHSLLVSGTGQKMGGKPPPPIHPQMPPRTAVMYALVLVGPEVEEVKGHQDRCRSFAQTLKVIK